MALRKGLTSGVTENFRAPLQNQILSRSRILRNRHRSGFGAPRVLPRVAGMVGYSYEDIRLNESDCEKSEVSTNVIDNIQVNPDIYVAREGEEWIAHNSNFPGRFTTRNVLRQNSGPTSFVKHNVNACRLESKDDVKEASQMVLRGLQKIASSRVFRDCTNADKNLLLPKVIALRWLAVGILIKTQ
ncbi:uncharacterized protein TNCV_3524351 [Trichonephila clavipes]|uniref:Uncharacterized protein n=1 Tax=Trichonephila clavipes TaxID=2585209 RepID=A0A8X6VGK7_TRICX|nr:uncharacterized protein TNCV_3524351 [Trichonephila clavipes]